MLDTPAERSEAHAGSPPGGRLTRRALLGVAATGTLLVPLVGCVRPSGQPAPPVADPRAGRRLVPARQAVRLAEPDAFRWHSDAVLASVNYPGVLGGDTGADDSGLQAEWTVRFLARGRGPEDASALAVYIKDGEVEHAEDAGPPTSPPRPWFGMVEPYNWPLDSEEAYRRALAAAGRPKLAAGLSSLSISMEYLESDDGAGWPRQPMYGWAVIFRSKGADYDPGLLVELDGAGRPIRTRDLRTGVVGYFDPYVPVLATAKEAWELLGLFARSWQPDAALTRFYGRVSAQSQPLLPGHTQGRLGRWRADFVSIKGRGLLRLSGTQTALGWALVDEGTKPASEPYLPVDTDRWRLDSVDVAAAFAEVGGEWLRTHPQPSKVVGVYFSLGPGSRGAPEWTIRYGDEVTDCVGAVVDAESGVALRSIRA